ncbi:MAG: hypothetical protein ACREC6_00985, partial [Hyphomicrobiaceae bacterium]
MVQRIALRFIFSVAVIGLRFFSCVRFVDGVRIAIAVPGNEPPDRMLDRVEEALRLIRRYDPRRFDRLVRDLKGGVVVLPHLGTDSDASFDSSTLACQIVSKLVLSEVAPEMLATIIVHEATHARLRRYGIGYDERLRFRVEAACFRREIAFAARLPRGE